MSALTKKEETLIAIMASKYALPVLYSVSEYGTTSRKVKSLKRTPQWTYDLSLLSDNPSNIEDSLSIGFCITGNWGVLPLLTLGITAYNESVENLLKLTISVQGNMRDNVEEDLLASYVEFLRDALSGSLPSISDNEIRDYSPVSTPNSNPKFPKCSIGGTDIMEYERLNKLALTVTDNMQTLKYLNQPMLFDIPVFDGLSRNPYVSQEVLNKVLSLLRAGKMDYTNTPEVAYYRIVTEISSVIERRVSL